MDLYWRESAGFLSTFRKLILPQMQKRADAFSEDMYGFGVQGV